MGSRTRCFDPGCESTDVLSGASLFPSHYISEDFILTDLITRMKAEIAAIEAAPSTAPLSSSVPSGLNGIPAVSDITLITYNLFDNGASHKTKWSSSRFAVSLQVFTLTTPFTPSPSLAAWTGTVQLLDPGFWHNYIAFKHEEGKVDQITFDRLTEMYRDLPGRKQERCVDRDLRGQVSWHRVLVAVLRPLLDQPVRGACPGDVAGRGHAAHRRVGDRKAGPRQRPPDPARPLQPPWYVGCQ